MKRYNVAILGATGAVGEQMIRVLWERRFPIGGLRLLSSERSAGGRMDNPVRKCGAWACLRDRL